MNKRNGITLVTLVITIIILLILAGISINAVLGENGILAKAGKSMFENERAEVEYQISEALANAYYDIYGYDYGKNLDKIYTVSTLNKLVSGRINAIVLKNNNKKIIWYTSIKNRKYTVYVDEFGNVKAEEKFNLPSDIEKIEWNIYEIASFDLPDNVEYNLANTLSIIENDDGTYSLNGTFEDNAINSDENGNKCIIVNGNIEGSPIIIYMKLEVKQVGNEDIKEPLKYGILATGLGDTQTIKSRNTSTPTDVTISKGWKYFYDDSPGDETNGNLYLIYSGYLEANAMPKYNLDNSEIAGIEVSNIYVRSNQDSSTLCTYLNSSGNWDMFTSAIKNKITSLLPNYTGIVTATGSPNMRQLLGSYRASGRENAENYKIGYYREGKVYESFIENIDGTANTLDEGKYEPIYINNNSSAYTRLGVGFVFWDPNHNKWNTDIDDWFQNSASLWVDTTSYWVGGLSPFYNDNCRVCDIFSDGTMRFDTYSYSYNCVRPVISIQKALGIYLALFED